MVAQVEAIIPDEGLMLTVAEIDKLVVDAIKGTQREATKDFKKTTRTWKRRVKFYSTKPVLAGGAMAAATGTDDDVYAYVNYGTRPHRIRARRAPMLRFQTGFTAKTTPGLLGSGRGGASGPFRSAVEVQHPGTKARKFDERVAHKTEETLRLEIEVGLLKAIG